MPVRQIRMATNAEMGERKMRDSRRIDGQDALLGSSHSEHAAFPVSPTDNDTELLALETRFHSLLAELLAAQKASGAACSDGRLVRGNLEADVSSLADPKKAEAILARLYPIERAIMATPARTIAGLGVKARHAAYVVSQYWDAPIDQIDWDARTTRLLIESVCDIAGTPVSRESK
jgi:hypothetical protein